MQHRFLEDEEDYLARPMPENPVEEDGFTGLGYGARRAVEVAGTAFKIAPECESPIEVMFGARLKLLIESWNSARKPELRLVPQFWLNHFRYDFAITAGDELVAAVECDGKDFHSSEQARANDAAKNVAVWSIGAEIFRFTGSKIFRREVECVDRVEKFLRGKYTKQGAA